MRLQPIIYTTDPDGAVEWYGKALGLTPSYRSNVWSTFEVAGTPLAIHRVDEELPPGSRVAISLVATEPLEDLIQRWGDAVEITRGIQDETFGRSLLVTDPDGTIIQVNEHAHQ